MPLTQVYSPYGVSKRSAFEVSWVLPVCSMMLLSKPTRSEMAIESIALR